MRARRTPLAHYLVALVLGLLGGSGISELGMSTRTDLMGVPWLVSLLLFLLGAAILIMAFQVHRYAKGDRKEMDLRFAVNVLIMSKALGIACAALLGWYGSQALISMGHAGVFGCILGLSDRCGGRSSGGMALPVAPERRS